MSFDLGVFYTTKPHTDAEAVKRYIAYCEEEDLSQYIEPSQNVAAFLAELTRQYPQIDDVSEEELESCPWSIAFDVSEGHVLMPMVWSAAETMYPVIVELAEKHRLVCVDPQSKSIVTAPPGIKVQGRKWWQVWKK
jgi:hypothetical protein